MKKITINSQNSSAGFTKTQVFRQQAEQSNPFEKTLKSISTDRQLLIQNFLDANANLEKHPFNQRVFTKTITVEAKNEEKTFENNPGVLQQKKFNYGNAFKSKSTKEPIVIIQSLVRRHLAKKFVKERKKYFQQLLKEDKKITLVDDWVKNEQQWAQQILGRLKQQPKEKKEEKRTISGLDKNNPFYHAQIEMMGEMGILEKEDFIEINPATAFNKSPIITEEVKLKKAPLIRLRPKSVEQSKVRPKIMPFSLPNDGCQIWKALYKKKYGKESLHDISMKEIKITDDYIKIENQEASKDKLRIDKVNKILEKEVPKEAKVVKIKENAPQKKRVEESIGEDIEDEIESEKQSEIKDEVEEDIPEDDEAIEEVEEIVSETQQQSQIKEESIMQESSVIKESIPSAQKSSKMIKESIQEEYANDFEAEESQQVVRTQQSQYEEDGFESYHSQMDPDTHRKKITPKSSDKVITPQIFVPEVKSVPIEIEPGWTTKRAQQEAEILLKNYTEKYSQLRQVEINDDDFEPLRQEHRDLKFIQKQVNSLLSHTGDFYKGWKDQPTSQPCASADQLYAKFQYEFQRLLSMNSLGARFSRIISQTVVKDIPAANIKGIMTGIEEQMQIVQRVLETVLFQVQQIFDSKQMIEEMRLSRKEMDQKLQWLLFKQDKLLNNQLAKQLEERDRELKKFIQAQFEKQRLEFGARKLAATVDPNSLSEALLKNQGLFSYRFEQSAQSKKESSIGKQKDKKSVKEESYYQPDFEGEESERIKTEKSEQNLYESSYQNSLTLDKEVEDASQQSDVDWQNDINLFENTQSSFINKKDIDAQQIVDYLTEMLMKEIQQDLFPQRAQLQNSQVKNDSNISSQYSESFEEESASASKEFIPEPKQPALIKKPQPKEEVDDFGMGKPAINRAELSQEFDLTDNSSFPSESIDKEKGKEIKLVADFRYQNFVQSILDKYGKQLEAKQKQIQTKFQAVMKQRKTKKSEPLSGELYKQMKFIEQKQVTEQNAFQIVQSLEEQLSEMLLKQHCENSKIDIPIAIQQAKKVVLKITEERIPCDAMSSDYKFDEIYNQGLRKPPLKECPINEGIAEVCIQEEAEHLGTQACEHILKQIMKDTMSDFDKIMQKKKK